MFSLRFREHKISSVSRVTRIGWRRWAENDVPVAIQVCAGAENIFRWSSRLSPHAISAPRVSVSINVENWNEVPLVTLSKQTNVRLIRCEKFIDDPRRRRRCDPFVRMNHRFEENRFLLRSCVEIQFNATNVATFVRQSNRKRWNHTRIWSDKRRHPGIYFLQRPISLPVLHRLESTRLQIFLINRPKMNKR